MVFYKRIQGLLTEFGAHTRRMPDSNGFFTSGKQFFKQVVDGQIAGGNGQDALARSS